MEAEVKTLGEQIAEAPTQLQKEKDVVAAALTKTQAKRAEKEAARIASQTEEQAKVEPEPNAPAEVAQPVIEKTETPAEPTPEVKAPVDPESVVKLWEQQEEKVEPPTDNSKYEELQKKYDSLLSKPSVAAILKAEQEGKDPFEIMSQVETLNPAKLSEDQMYGMLLTDLGITTKEEIEGAMDEWSSKTPLEKKMLLKPFKEQLTNNYNNEKKNLRVDYIPAENEYKLKEQKNFEEFQEIGKSRLDKLMFGNTLKVTTEVLKRTSDFMSKDFNVEKMHDALLLYSHFPIVQKRIWEAAQQAVLAEKIPALQGSTQRMQTASPVFVKDESKQAKAESLAKQIVDNSTLGKKA